MLLPSLNLSISQSLGLSMPDRYLASFDTQHVSQEVADVLIIGTGITGLTAAIHAARRAKM